MTKNNVTPRVALGFDYGEKKIGVAIGNDCTGIARALTTIENQSIFSMFSVIQGLVKQWCPDILIVGLPLDVDGREQEMTRLAKKFGRRLYGRFHLPIIFMDERYSSLEAYSFVRLRSKVKVCIDAEAARIILQQYFDGF